MFAIDQFEVISKIGKWLFLSAIFCYQYKMGACINDSAKKPKDNLKANPNLEQELLSIISKICWSKNVSYERDAPKQILSGAEHWYYCVLTGWVVDWRRVWQVNECTLWYWWIEWSQNNWVKRIRCHEGHPWWWLVWGSD